MEAEQEREYPPRFKIYCTKTGNEHLQFDFDVIIKNPDEDILPLSIPVFKHSAGNKILTQ